MVIYLRALAGVALAGAIAMRAQERRIVEALELAGAVTPETATKLPLGNFLRKMIFRRLLNVGAVGETMMQLQYLKVVEYAEWQARRRKRALIAVSLLLIVALGVWLAGCAPKQADATSSVRDSAGVQIIEHPASVIAAAPAWTVDTGTHLWTIGGGDDPDQDVDATSCAFWEEGHATICHREPNEVRVYDGEGKIIRRFGRKGMGPGEFESYYLLGTNGDTLDFWDVTLSRLSSFERSGKFVRSVSYASLPRERILPVAGRLTNGLLVTMPNAWQGGEAADLNGARALMPVYLLSVDGTNADSFAGHPGFRLYRGIVNEGGGSFASTTTYHLDGPSVISVDPEGFTVAVPDTAIVVRRGGNASVQRSIRLALPRRAMTADDRERYIARDSIQYATQQPRFLADMMKNYREGRFVDFLAPFERIVQGPARETWLERTWLSSDSIKQYLVLDSAGMVAATVTIPMKRTLWWIGQDAVLTSWRDSDEARHLSLHPLHRTTPVDREAP